MNIISCQGTDISCVMWPLEISFAHLCTWCENESEKGNSSTVITSLDFMPRWKVSWIPRPHIKNCWLLPGIPVAQEVPLGGGKMKVSSSRNRAVLLVRLLQPRHSRAMWPLLSWEVMKVKHQGPWGAPPPLYSGSEQIEEPNKDVANGNLTAIFMTRLLWGYDLDWQPVSLLMEPKNCQPALLLQAGWRPSWAATKPHLEQWELWRAWSTCT